jgi:exodeoxyribonuclease VII small subunit
MTSAQSGEQGEKLPSFEDAFRELEATVHQLDTAQGELSLEETIALYKRGVLLAQHCSEALDAAELQVQKLSLRSNDEQMEMFLDEDV